MANDRIEPNAVTSRPTDFASFAYSAPLWVIEFEGMTYLAAPKEDSRGAWVRPIADKDLATRFLSLDGAPEALAEYFQRVGLPTAPMRTRQTPAQFRKMIEKFGLAEHSPIGVVQTFRAGLGLYATVLSAVQAEPKHANDFVPAPRRNRGWVLEATIHGQEAGRSLRQGDPRADWIASQPYDQRRFLACHVILTDLLQELMRDRFVLAPELHVTRTFEVGQVVYYEPRDVLGAILFQMIDSLRAGRRLVPCSHCGRPFVSHRRDRVTCSDRCRQAARRQRLAGERATVQQ